MKLIDTSCYYCGNTESSAYDFENGHRLVKCTSCGLIYLNPRPADEEINEATTTGEHRGQKTIDVTGCFDDSKLPRYDAILRDMFPKPLPATSRWLDIGCGHGEFLSALERRFGKQHCFIGCEPNASKVLSARARGLDVSSFSLEEHGGKYDYVSLLNVFSHLPNPRETIACWSRLIREGGCLILETGHSCHLPAEQHHKPYYLPDHLSFANREIVEGILTSIGFEVIRTRIYRHTVFPNLTPGRIAREAIKCLLQRPNSLRAFFPPQPRRDMFILARRVAAIS